MGTCAPGQTLKEEALSSQEDAVQFRWVVEFILQLWAAEALEELLERDKKEGKPLDPKGLGKTSLQLLLSGQNHRPTHIHKPHPQCLEREARNSLSFCTYDLIPFKMLF